MHGRSLKGIFLTDVKNDHGESPLDTAVRASQSDIALYLMNVHGCGDKDKGRLLTKACQSGTLKMVKELVEQHNINPKGEKFNTESAVVSPIPH